MVKRIYSVMVIVFNPRLHDTMRRSDRRALPFSLINE